MLRRSVSNRDSASIRANTSRQRLTFCRYRCRSSRVNCVFATSCPMGRPFPGSPGHNLGTTGVTCDRRATDGLASRPTHPPGGPRCRVLSSPRPTVLVCACCTPPTGTSGRSFHREDLLPAQAQFVDFLVETVRAERVDAVLVVRRRLRPGAAPGRRRGGVRRRAAPARRHRRPGRPDQRQPRLRPPAGLRLRADRRRRHPPAHRRSRRAPAGPARTTRRPGRRLRRPLSRARCGARRARLRRAQPRRRPRRGDEPGARPTWPAGRAPARSCWPTRSSTGAEPSESERDISVGGVPSVPLSVFAGVDYAALGHLHGAQRLSDRVRYSGSPLPFSFSEEHHTKQVLLVELGPAVRVARRRRARADAGAPPAGPALRPARRPAHRRRGGRRTRATSCR